MTTSAALINAAFAYARPGGNRFSGEDRGAWYCAFACETALAEVAFHLTRALEAVGRYDNTTDYAELLADFIGRFHDLRGMAGAPCLDPDPAVGYPAGQALARRVLAADGSGILYPSVRRPGGTCLAALRPHIVQNVRPGGTWRLAATATGRARAPGSPHRCRWRRSARPTRTHWPPRWASGRTAR